MMLAAELQDEFNDFEDFGDLEEESQVEVPEVFYDKFQKLAVSLSQHYLELFFKGGTDMSGRVLNELQIYYGGPVPKIFMMRLNLLRLVLNITQIQGVDMAYEILAKCSQEYEVQRHSHITNHMKFVLDFVDRCVRLNIPPCFRGGILLAALKYYLGCPVNV